jgi:hypothetical protein
MTSLYHKEVAKFRMHCFKVNRAQQSGASADDVDMINEHKTCCTDLFFEFEAERRPMSVPPLTMSGGSAGSGGVASTFPRTKSQKRKASCASEDEEQHSGDDDHEQDDDDEGEASQSSSSSGTVMDLCRPNKTPIYMTPSSERDVQLHLGGSKPVKSRPLKKSAGKGDDVLATLMAHLVQQDKEAAQLRFADRQREREHERALFALLSPASRAGGRGKSPELCD